MQQVELLELVHQNTSVLLSNVPWWQKHPQDESTQISCLFIIHLKPNLESGVSIQTEVLLSLWLIILFGIFLNLNEIVKSQTWENYLRK